jgi:lipopolysaccharide/colanic/teichoic acid biosynthesis glycosyltransferase
MKAEISHAGHWSFSRGKRLFDSVVSAAVLTVTCIPMAVIALCVRLTSAGPAIFVQKRVGRHSRLFRLYKFRTMTMAPRGSGCGLTHSGDVRITPVGRWLRRLKLDELPQFFNVLRGDMSIVGPRPKLPQYADRLTLAYRPGITGAATLAFRCEEDILACVHAHEIDAFYHDRIKPMKASIDERYLRTATFFSDVRIVFDTLLASLLPDAYPALKHHEVTAYSSTERDRPLSALMSVAPPKRAGERPVMSLPAAITTQAIRGFPYFRRTSYTPLQSEGSGGGSGNSRIHK